MPIVDTRPKARRAVAARLTHYDFARVKALAVRDGVTVSDALRACLESGLPLVEKYGEPRERKQAVAAELTGAT